MSADTPTVFGPKATEQIAQTVREVARRMQNEQPHRARYMHLGGTGNQRWGNLLADTGHDDKFVDVETFSAADDQAFVDFTCGPNAVTMKDMAFTFCNSLGSVRALVPAGYKAGPVGLMKWATCGTPNTSPPYEGWTVVFGRRVRCTARIPSKIECCPITGLKFTEWKHIWYFGGALPDELTPC